MRFYRKEDIAELVEECVNELFWAIEDENGWAGDISPLESIALAEAMEQLTDVVKKWHDNRIG